MGNVTQSPMAGSGRPAGRISRRSKSAQPEPYDFRRPTKLSRENLRTLQLSYETFARQLATLFTTTLRVVSTVSFLSIEQRSYDEYVASLENRTVMALFTMEPLPGTAVLEFSLSTAMACIDHLLGGPGGPQPQRPLTDIETPLLQGLLERALGELRYAFEPIVAVLPKLATIEYSPQFAQAGVASDAVVIASFDMKVGGEECVATVCLPFALIFPKLQGERGDVAVSESQRLARATAHRNVAVGLEGAPVDVTVRFKPVRMHPADLVNLQPGDVVPLSHPTSVPLIVATADIPFAHAVPGSQGARLACLVVPSPEPTENRR